MYTALYRQWRPQKLGEIRGQSHVTRTLNNALAQGRIGHAYLFCGPRGVGKTTVARILARAVNCKNGVSAEPCGECSCCVAISAGSSLDVLEIDAASNRGIDEIRELRDKARFYPADCRYKVYIIDEVHMLTTEAFNALLKTLEEPPAHVIFILATTEPHRIPLTILSRCQRFDFHRLEIEEIVAQMEEIIDRTDASAEAPALTAIAKAADGSMRDALSVLDQALTMGEGAVTEASVLAILGIPDKLAVSNTVKAIAAGDAAGLFGLVDELLKTGKDLRQFFKDLAAYIRDLLLIATGARDIRGVSGAELADIKKDAELFCAPFLIEALKMVAETESEMRIGGWPRLVVETTLLSLMNKAVSGTETAVSVSVAPQKPAPRRASAPKAAAVKAKAETPAADRAKTDTAKAKPAQTAKPEAVKERAQTPAPPQQDEPAQKADLSVESVRGQWQAILATVRRESAIASALLQEGTPVCVEPDALTVAFKHRFHRESLEAEDKKAIVERALSAHLHRNLRLELEMIEPEKPKRDDPLDDPLVKGALELFGGEIIEDDGNEG